MILFIRQLIHEEYYFHQTYRKDISWLSDEKVSTDVILHFSTLLYYFFRVALV